VVAPLLIALIFGIVEFGWVFMAQQSLTTAAREGARTAVLQGSTEQDVVDRISSFLDQAGISNYNIEVQHGTTEDPIETVRVRVPYRAVSLLRGGGFDPEDPDYGSGAFDFDLGACCSMRKEGAG